MGTNCDTLLRHLTQKKGRLPTSDVSISFCLHYVLFVKVKILLYIFVLLIIQYFGNAICFTKDPKIEYDEMIISNITDFSLISKISDHSF